MHVIDGVALSGEQEQEWRALAADVGAAVADEVFALGHIHDRVQWVPLEAVNQAETDPEYMVADLRPKKDKDDA